MNSPKETKKMIWLMKQIFVKGSVYKGFLPFGEQYVNVPAPYGISYIRDTDIMVCLDSKPRRDGCIFYFEILTKDGSGYIGFSIQNAEGWIPVLEAALTRRIYKSC